MGPDLFLPSDEPTFLIDDLDDGSRKTQAELSRILRQAEDLDKQVRDINKQIVLFRIDSVGGGLNPSGNILKASVRWLVFVVIFLFGQ